LLKLILSHKYSSTVLILIIGSILLFLDIEIPPSRFYISVSYLGVAYQNIRAFLKKINVYFSELKEWEDRHSTINV
ncbi:MAG: hypothetical protein IJH71_01765, partial [Eubacterium sp.]|nr:hypothetical protein [Eubacterium sp.]